MTLYEIERGAIWRHVRRHLRRSLFGLALSVLGLAAGIPVGWMGSDHYRAARLVNGAPVRLTFDEGRLLRAAGASPTIHLDSLSVEELENRLSLTSEALQLARLLDQSRELDTSGLVSWWRTGTADRLGGSASITAVVEMLARRTPTQRPSVIALLEEFGRSTAALRALLLWASQLPETERASFLSIDRGALGTERGLKTLVMLAAAAPDQFSWVEHAIRIPPGAARHALAFAQRPADETAMLAYIVGLSETRKRSLFDVLHAYEGQAKGHTDAPYPCLDRPSYGWTRGNQPLRTCTVALP